MATHSSAWVLADRSCVAEALVNRADRESESDRAGVVQELLAGEHRADDSIHAEGRVSSPRLGDPVA